MRNKYLLSFFGKWGNDKIFMPGWAFNQYIAGISLAYYKQLSDKPREYTYRLSVGTGFEVNKPYESDLPEGDTRQSGRSLYLNLSGDPARLIFEDYKHLYLEIEMLATFADFKPKDYGYTDTTDFYTLRNYFTVSIKQLNIVNLFDFGTLEAAIGYSNYDISLMRVIPKHRELTDLSSGMPDYKKLDNHIFGQIGIYRTGGLIQHHVTSTFGYNTSRKIFSVGLNLNFMLSNTFGFDIRYVNSNSTENRNTPWLSDSYLVFSPIFRINY